MKLIVSLLLTFNVYVNELILDLFMSLWILSVIYTCLTRTLKVTSLLKLWKSEAFQERHNKLVNVISLKYQEVV